MMKLIGFKRSLLLAALAALNLVLLSIYFLGVEPMRSTAELTRDSVAAEISGLQGKIQNIKQEMISFTENMPRYDALKARGFFMDQNRFQIGRDLDAVRTASGVRGFTYNINDIVPVKNMVAEAAQMSLITSHIQIQNVDTLIDTDFYNFIDLMQTQFPAHLRLSSLHIQRAGILDESTLKALADRQAVKIVTATAEADWLTLVPVGSLAGSDTQGNAPVSPPPAGGTE